MLELDRVSVGFGGESILENCSLRVDSGEHIAIMGPSGSGKTTLLRLISGLCAPSAGKISTGSARISCVFQEPRLLPWLTAEENVNLVLSDRADTALTARRCLDAVGLNDSYGKRPSELSGGMRQRVALARALAYDGELFLLDEPMSALDSELTAELIALIKQRLADKTLIMVTHSIEQARQSADKIYIIKNKKLELL